MNNIVIREKEIQNMIYEIRGRQVMLDSDLAKLYECKNGTKEINQAVKRNNERFPEDFYFQLTFEEFFNLKSQFVTSSWNEYGGIRKLPYVFTEDGAAMLSGLLRSEIAVEMSKKIIRAFVAMRKYIGSNLIAQNSINNMVLKHDNEISKNTNDIKKLQNAFKQFEEKRVVNEIYYKGQIFDAYAKIKSIFKEAKEELIIVDGYADINVLNIVKELDIKVIIIVKKKAILSKQDIEKYNKQYNNLTVIYNDDFHDRYFIIDRNKIYHCGASINYAGSKTFSINELEDEIVKDSLINKMKILIK